jgi:phosphatidylglycerol:prolipoprotein diacylglycerol transferase
MLPVLSLPFPQIDPVLIQLGPFAVRWYALAYVAGILGGWWLGARIAVRDDLFAPHPAPGKAALDDMILWAALGVVVGGRLGFVLFYNLDYYLAHPLEIPQVWRGGMAFHGGAIGMIVATWAYARARDVSFLSLMDVIAAVAPIGLFFGRLANFVNGELYGRVTDVWWAVAFPAGGYLPRHPSQLYQAGLEGLVLFAALMVLVFRQRALGRPGFVSGAFLAGYGVLRIIGEVFREPDPQLGFLWGGLTMGQFLSVPMLLAGLALMAWARKRAA